MFFALALTAQQTVAAAEQSLIEIAAVLGVIVITSYVSTYAITHIAKRWRRDHNKALRIASSSLIRATIIAFAAFQGLWYGAYELGALTAYKWQVGIIIGGIFAPFAPLSWNPLIAVVGKYSKEARDALKEQ